MEQTRETWLAVAIDALRPIIESKGYTLPKVRVSVGWPKGHGRMDMVIGQCWHKANSTDGTFEMFISPVLDDPARVLDVLVHELGHACLPGHGHDKAFAAYCRAMYLKGPWTATTQGPRFEEEIIKPVFCAESFAYPHRRMIVGGWTEPRKPDSPDGPLQPAEPRGRIGKQGTRMLKRSCGCCGYTVRLSKRWLEVATPTCPDQSCLRFGEDMV